MLPDVRINVQDGGLGLQAPGPSGIHAKVGTCSAGTVNAIVRVTDPKKIPELFGTGPLANALYDSFLGGSQLVYAVRANGDVAGTISAVTATKTGTGNMTVSGTPLDAYDVIVEVLSEGAVGTATFRYSLDGGDTWTKAITTAASVELTGTGLTLAFTNGAVPADSFDVGDKYTFTSTAPGATVNSVTAAIDALLASNYEYEFIHVVGASDSSVWTALDIKANDAANAYRYIHFLAEARGPNVGETPAQWVDALITAQGTFTSTRVSVCAGRLELIDPATNRQVDRNGAGLYAGRVSAIPVMRSPGRVKDGALPNVVRLNPIGISDGDIDALDQAGFITFRQYVGLEGFYVTNGRIMAPSTSDFQYVELRRVMDKACRNTRLRALQFEHAEASGAGLDALEAELNVVPEEMIGAGEIAAGKVTIPRDQDIVGTSTLLARVAIQPVGIMRNIEIDIGFENPLA